MRIVLILGVLASPNHPSWGHLGVIGSGPLFRVPFWVPFLRGFGSIFGAKMGSYICFFRDLFLVIFLVLFFMVFGVHFGAQNGPKAKRNDFEKVCFDMFFAGILEHQASEARPKTAKKASKTVPRSLPDLSKTCSILGSRFFDFRIPFWGPKRSPEEPKTEPKGGSKKLSFFDQFWTKNGAIFGAIPGTLFGGFSG